MKRYSYYFKNDIFDKICVVTNKYYETAVDLLKNEFPNEYKELKNKGYKDNEIPCTEFLREELK